MTINPKIDAVIAYVDAQKPDLQTELLHYANIDKKKIKNRRFRSYGTLSTLIGCIRKNMPFIYNIYVVVYNENQIPEDCNDLDSVKFVFHNQIIPSEFLPTFNSQTIEMFLHKVPGLSDKYIYFNDDMFPVMSLSPEEFFKDDKPVWHLKHWKLSDLKNSFRHVCLNSYLFACNAMHMQPNLDDIIVPYHSISPMFREDCEEVFEANKTNIFSGITRFRSNFNLNQYVFSDYSILKRGYSESEDIFRYIKLADICNVDTQSLKDTGIKIVCLNDICNDEDFEKLIEQDSIKSFLRSFDLTR